MQSYNFQKIVINSIFCHLQKFALFLLLSWSQQNPPCGVSFFEKVMILFCSDGEQFVLLSPLCHYYLHFSFSSFISFQLFDFHLVSVVELFHSFFSCSSLQLYTLHGFWKLFSFLSACFVVFFYFWDLMSPSAVYLNSSFPS